MDSSEDVSQTETPVDQAASNALVLPSSIDVTEHPEIFSLHSKEAIIKLAAKSPFLNCIGVVASGRN